MMFKDQARVRTGSRLLLLLLLFTVSVFAQTPTVVFDGQTFKITGWSDAGRYSAEQFSAFFSVSVDAPDVQPMGGEYQVEAGQLTFIPRYPLSAGMRYRAEVRLPSKPAFVKIFETPKADQTPTATVEHIYPSANLLPENQLKIYIHFSEPMSRGEAYEHVYLIDSRGQRVDRPFLELGEELWDPQGKRLTVFFDPGRIKSGLVPHNELGMPVQAGHSYTLVVDRNFHDATRKLLKNQFTKSFTVGPADRQPLDLTAWHLTSPRSSTADSVTIDFPEPLDHALLESQLEIADAEGTIVKGIIEIDRDETRWKFTPHTLWKAGAHTVRIGTIIEDLAGNMINRPFEVDVFERVGQTLTRETRLLPFTIN
jgi:hypothetical protein